jgi:DNA-binding MarR family transcriptional regulator
MPTSLCLASETVLLAIHCPGKRNYLMDEKEIRTLHILESVERETPPSQRDLARELNISLGLVNAFIKRLVKKGYFKVTHIPKNRIRYILTPEGAAEKTRLTYSYILHSYRLFKKAYEKLRRLLIEMEANGIQRIILFGATDLAEIACLISSESSIEIVGIVDDVQRGTRIAGRRILSSHTLKTAHFDKVLVTSTEPKPVVLKRLETIGIEEEKIATL